MSNLFVTILKDLEGIDSIKKLAYKIIMKKLSLTFLLFFFEIAFIYSQSSHDVFNKAKEFYENGNNKECINLLVTIQSQIGANPKIYSLYIYAYLGENDYINAKIAMNTFKKLIGNKSSENISAVLSLEKEIDAAIDKLEKEHKQNIENKRMQEADNAISQTYNTAERKEVIAQQKANKKQVELLQTELEAFQAVVNSGSEDKASDFYYKYPNSFYKDSVYTIWQLNFLNTASNLTNESALNKLNAYKTQFSSPKFYNNAKELYDKKWNDCLNYYSDNLAFNKKERNKLVGNTFAKSMLLGGLYFGIGYAVGYFTSDSGSNNPLIFGSLMGGLGVVLVVSDKHKKISRKNSEVRESKKQVKYYKVAPSY